MHVAYTTILLYISLIQYVYLHAKSGEVHAPVKMQLGNVYIQ